jgi:hypothetical protein
MSEEFWIWRGQVYAKEWLEKHSEASKARFEHVSRDIIKYRISDEPTRELVMQGWLKEQESITC